MTELINETFRENGTFLEMGRKVTWRSRSTTGSEPDATVKLRARDGRTRIRIEDHRVSAKVLGVCGYATSALVAFMSIRNLGHNAWFDAALAFVVAAALAVVVSKTMKAAQERRTRDLADCFHKLRRLVSETAARPRVASHARIAEVRPEMFVELERESAASEPRRAAS